MPTIRITVHSYDTQANGPTIAQTRDRFTKKVLRKQMAGWLRASSAPSTFTLPTPPFYVQSYIDKYSEQVTANPVDDLRKYFAASGRGGTTYGGISSGSLILSYRPRELQINTAAVAAVGEGLAGWYLEDKEGLACVARPTGVSPDFVFEDPQTGTYALVEVKTRLKEENIATDMKDAGLSVLDILAKTKLIRPGSYLAYVLGVVIYDVDDYAIHRLRIEEV